MTGQAAGSGTAPGARPVPAVGRVLAVCTGNVCRSPYIERRLAAMLADTDVIVSSAGTLALVGAPVEPGSVRALQSVGADASGFASRQVTGAILVQADLVLAASQAHRAEVVRVNPSVLRRTFTLGELADLLRDADLAEAGAALDPGLPWARRLAEIAFTRRGLVRARPAEDADIPDPYGREAAAYANMASEIEKALLVVGPALRPPDL